MAAAPSQPSQPLQEKTDLPSRDGTGEAGFVSDSSTANVPAKTDGQPPPSTAPDGGLKAWSVAAGASCITFCTLGFANSFGTFQQYYLTHQLASRSPDDVAWIGSISIFLQLSVGLIAGPLFDRYGAIVLRPAAVGYLFAVMMLSLCTEYWQIMLVQGVLMGLCQGMLQLPGMASVSQWFDKKRGVALGMVVAGSSVGGIVFPIILAKLFNESDLGFGWTVRVVGFIMMPFMLFCAIAVVPRVPPRKTNFWLLSAFKNKQWLLIVLSFALSLVGMFTPLFFLPVYAVSRGVEPALAGYLIAMVNGASTFGRVIPGILADKYGRLNMMVLAGVSSGIIIFCFNLVTSTAGFVVYSVIFGFFSGSIFSAAIAAITGTTSDPREFGSYMGMGTALAAIGPLIGPPVDGALVAKYGGFEEASYFGGAVCLAGGLIAIGAKAVRPEGVFGKS
ncbi:major facilitator superfamily domain-containing protein [Microdochium trichocladiopsis]|uniref:Major facilitator superfamily domain-containing protein n=1 Tax=Microdochium trichocladiopsis TaxID=1682393 RepID=A0A9P8XZM7_9PEZI|nr:major facilitator superfamily domain-containing protein [Microdochium trichocladiopsis]KAH7024990.1 major facilitator superfamily domain-containing protein [Microdochium trichocladiopsis]